MKNLILLLLLFCGAQSVNASEITGYKNAKWGMSLEKVKLLFPKGNIANKTGWATKTKVIDLEAIVYFEFVKKKLARVTLLFNKRYLNASRHIEDYNKLKTLLVKKYEAPSKDKETWNDPQMKQDRGLALIGGYVSFATKWEKPNSNLLIYLIGRDLKAHLSIVYESKSGSADLNSASEKKSLNEL